jgi:succinate dehydrogenase / fumarate reductase, cytochrome b subunit
MLDKRPRFLNLTQISFPITAIASICQRISGVVLFLGIPVILYFVQQSLTDINEFNQIRNSLYVNLWLKLAILIYMAALVFHVIGGLRHLIMDIGYLEELCVAKFTSWLTFILTVLVLIPVAYWLL